VCLTHFTVDQHLLYLTSPFSSMTTFQTSKQAKSKSAKSMPTEFPTMFPVSLTATII
jgi:hypothetical protein